MARAFIAAGSNVEPFPNLERAAEELRREFPGVRFSPWYRNRAAVFEGDYFINFVA
jgi:7,8-dihydro-6-hydroxymethylpterin-pyrophosphokinase